MKQLIEYIFVTTVISTILLAVSASSNEVSQTPIDLIIKNGESPSLQCSHGITSYNRILWYKQTEDGRFNFMGYIVGLQPARLEPEYKVDLTGDGNSNATLSITSVTPNDSAVYYCAATGAAQAFFGTGTKLTVLDPQKEIRHPNITVLKPNATEECKKKRVTLVCMITNFYPDHVKVSWYSNGVEKTGGVATDSAATHEDDQKTYKISSRLSIDHKEWKRGRTYRCTVTFYNGTGYTDWSAFVNGPQDDGVYKAKVNIAFLGYIASLGKSAVYGFFIMFIVMRKYFVSK